MNKCKICSNECTGNTCSGSCRAKLSRRTRTGDLGAQVRRTQSSARTEITPVFNGCPNSPPPAVIKRVAGAIQAAIDKSAVATRTNPDQLNYGKPLSMHGLKKAGLKANRVPIPGDHDYTGVCEQVDGK